MFLLEDHMSLYIVISMYMYSNLQNIFPCIDSVLSELAAARGWQIAGETVHIRKQGELIKPKKILAKIDMESEWQGCAECHPSSHIIIVVKIH